MKKKEEQNTDLRILAKRVKLFKALTIIFTIMAPLSLLGVGFKYPYSIFFVSLCGAFFIAAVVCAIIMQRYVNRTNRNIEYLKNVSENLKERRKSLDEFLILTYGSINCDGYENCGKVYFAREGISFSAEGRYVTEKDFNGVKGNHLALQIRGVEMASAPDGYDDVMDYESNLFTLNIGYFDDSPLTEENDTGLILPDGGLAGKKFFFSSGHGYVCNLDTAETDDIDYGELNIEEAEEDSITVSFKCMVKYGACDIVSGKVKLLRDGSNLN